MNKSIAPEGLHQKIMMWAAIAGLFFGLMPPYVFTIVIVATWGVPPLEPPAEQSFRMVYFLRLVLGNVVGLTLGAFHRSSRRETGAANRGKGDLPKGCDRRSDTWCGGGFSHCGLVSLLAVDQLH